MPPADALREGARIFTICNACRYCEGYCAVFPAMERRLRFTPADVHYLANLCHHCGDCLDACQYAPPHEFGVDVPAALAEIRTTTYREYAPPRWVVAIALAALAAMVYVFSGAPRGGGFYRVIPYAVMAAAFSVAAVFVAAAWAASVMRFGPAAGPAAILRAARAALTLQYMAGAEPRSRLRRAFHHAAFYGFLLCLASTTAAAYYHHVLGREAPYDYFSLPVALGTLGGIGLLVGSAGLHYVKRESTLPALLFFTSLTGFALLALRETAAMPGLLYLHLAVVLALFAAMPYGKFVHGLYRFAALVRYAVEHKS